MQTPPTASPAHAAACNAVDQLVDPRFCKDCSHQTTYMRGTHRCSAPVLGLDIVTGEANHEDCRAMRRPSSASGHGKGPCGPEALMFEPKSESLDRTGRLNTCKNLVHDESGVSVSAIGVELMPLGFAPFGEIVRVNVNADHAPAFCLKTFAADFGCGQPLIVGPMEFVTVLKHEQQPSPVLSPVPDHAGCLNASCHVRTP